MAEGSRKKRMRGKSGLDFDKLARHCQERFNQNPSMSVEQVQTMGQEIYGVTFSLANARTLVTRLKGEHGASRNHQSTI